MIQTDICIIGAGPVGLFAIFECGLLKLKCHLVDALPAVGGQLTEIYPQKPIYDIPGYPSVLAGDLIENLMEQAKPFEPEFTLGERVEGLEKLEDGSFIVTTSENTQIAAKAVVIAGGLGSFEPRKPALERLVEFERHGVEYMVKDPEKFRDKKVVIAGGGDSALDWAVYLAEMTTSLTVVHRRDKFRGAPDTAAKVESLAAEGKLNLMLNSQLAGLQGGPELEGVEVKTQDGVELVSADFLIPLFGLSPKLGPIAEWGLNIDKRAVEVDTRDYSTNVPGVYAIGDINTYPGKLKLILCGFHEAALMAHSASAYIYPEKKITLKYTTVTGIEGME